MSRINTPDNSGLRVQIDGSRNRQTPKTSFGDVLGTGLSKTADTVMGATARTAKCRSIASDTNTTAAIGAPNPAEIAAATPHATYISGVSRVGNKARTWAPTDAPKCRTGPY